MLYKEMMIAGRSEQGKDSVRWTMSSIATDEDVVDRWIEIDDSFSVPEQTLDEILADKILDLDDELLSGLDDEESLITTPHQSRSFSPEAYTLESPIHLSKLESISCQLRKHLEQNASGHASALAASKSHIVVGTNRGLLLIFHQQTQSLERSLSNDGCPVSCLNFNFDGTRLAVGYSTGLIQVYSITTGRLIDATCDIIQAGRGVLQMVFVGSGRKLACVDSGGSVYQIWTSTTMRSMRSKCIFSGSHGEVVYMMVVDNGQYLALLSLKKFFLISLPDLKLSYATAFVGLANRPPLIDSQLINFKDTSTQGRVRNVLLCVGRGTKVKFYRLELGVVAKVINIRTLSLDYEMINMKWIGPYYLLVVDANEKAHLLDIGNGEVAVDDLAQLRIVYGTADFKGLSTGGSVSAALDYMANSVCYQSIKRLGNSVYILGESSVCCVFVSDQLAQLETLMERGDVVPAVLYALDLFSGKIADRSKQANVKHSVSMYIPVLVRELLSVTTAGLRNGKVVQLVGHYKRHIHLLVRACITTSQFDLLYNTVYPCLEKDALSRGIFFDCLDEVVLDGHLNNPPPVLISDYFHHLILEGNLSQFEQAVVRIPVDRQDIDYVMKTCRSNRLYDGVIYIFNKALGDYISPLEEMFENMGKFIDCDMFSDCEVAMGNKLLLYIQCCLAGRAYPIGALPVEIEKKLPLLVYRCLISLRGKDGSSVSPTYPYLRLLLKFDALQFFNVIITSSDCPFFVNEEGRLETFMDTVYKIISSCRFDAVLYLHYFFLISHLLQKKVILPPAELVFELIEIVMSSDEPVLRTAEVERCVVEMMQCVSGLDDTKILNAAKKVPHLQICAYIYTSRREFTSLIECYLTHKTNSVPLVRDLLVDLKNDELEKFSNYVRSSITLLAEVEPFATAELVIDFYTDWLQNESEGIENAYLFYNCFLVRRERGYRTLTDDDAQDERLLLKAIDGLCKHYDGIDFDEKLAEFLRYWVATAARTDQSLNYAIMHNYIATSILLLEARHLYGRAFELLFVDLEKAWLKDEKRVSYLIAETVRLANMYHEESREGKWLFKILHKILSLSHLELQEGSEMMARLNSVIAAIIEGGSADAEDLVDALFSHPVFRSATYAKVRPLISSLFASCRYECVIMEATVRCVEDEIAEKLKYLTKQLTAKATPLVTSSICYLCGKASNKSSLLFNCGHLIHLECQPDNCARCCPCRTATFHSQSVPDNLVGIRRKKPEKRDFFNTDSLRLSLGPRYI